MKKKMRIVYEVLGGHTHISIFTGNAGGGLGKAGDICMTNEEFSQWRDATIEIEWQDAGK